MPNPNAIVSTTVRLDPPLDRSPDELLHSERGLSVELEGGRRVRLDPANERSAGFARVLDGLSKERLPVYVEIDPASNAVTRILIPHVARVIGVHPVPLPGRRMPRPRSRDVPPDDRHGPLAAKDLDHNGVGRMLHVNTKNNPMCFVEWYWHVAPILCVRGPGWFRTQNMVIDPSLFTTPVSESTWVGAQNDPGATITYLDASSFNPSGSTDPTYSITNAILAYNRMNLLNRSVLVGPPPYANCP